MIILRFSMQEEDLVEHTNGKCYVLAFQYARGKMFLSTVMPSIICVHFSQVCRPLCNISRHLVLFIEHTHAKSIRKCT
jgi:hypothetical protein